MIKLDISILRFTLNLFFIDKMYYEVILNFIA